MTVTGADEPSGQVNAKELNKTNTTYNQEITITVSGDNKATIIVTRNNTEVVNTQVDQAKQITIP